MLKSYIFSGRTMELNERLREDIEAELERYAGPYGEMAVSVAFDVALVQRERASVQARINEKTVEIALKFVPPVQPLSATARSRGASMAMLETLCRKGVIEIRRTPAATYLLVKVRRVDNVKVTVADLRRRPTTVAARL